MKEEDLIVKFLTNRATEEDLESLNFWLENKKNRQLFNSLVKTRYLTTLSADKFDLEYAKKKVSERLKIAEKNHKISRIKRYAGIVAVIAVVLLSPFVLKQYLKDKKTADTVVSTIEPGKSKAILTLENGVQISLNKGQKYTTDKINSNGEKIVYRQNASKKPSEKISYNYLKVPRGGQFFVQLSDGTKVWLNSDSALKYPVHFVEGQTREVELLYGEAYFEVSHSEKHRGARFQVKTNSQLVTVFGTQFNIEAYRGENTVTTTLVRGKVSVSNGAITKKLQPGMQSKVDNKTDKIDIFSVDVDYAVAWKNGVFLFKKESLVDIMNVLSRWYDVKVVFKDPSKREFVFSGRLDRADKIDGLLKNIEKTSEVTFKIKKDTITIE